MPRLKKAFFDFWTPRSQAWRAFLNSILSSLLPSLRSFSGSYFRLSFGFNSRLRSTISTYPRIAQRATPTTVILSSGTGFLVQWTRHQPTATITILQIIYAKLIQKTSEIATAENNNFVTAGICTCITLVA